jgi:hypothetical protein
MATARATDYWLLATPLHFLVLRISVLLTTDYWLLTTLLHFLVLRINIFI